MKTFPYLFLFAALTVSAQTSKNAKKSTQPAPATAPTEVTIPKDAVLQSDGNYHYTDAQGKKWLYRKTPFGVSKVEDKPVTAAPQKEMEDTLTIATDAGDSVHFEKPSPFGTVKWDKKKTELDSNEQSVWNRQKKQ